MIKLTQIGLVLAASMPVSLSSRLEAPDPIVVGLRPPQIVVGVSPPAVEPKSQLEFVRIPEGTFRERPALVSGVVPSSQRIVRIPSLWIGVTDVTVAAYQRCTLASVCSAQPRDRDEETPRCAWKNGLPTHPINCVSWLEASRFCEWIDGRLPTATEWEYAAASGDT